MQCCTSAVYTAALHLSISLLLTNQYYVAVAKQMLMFFSERAIVGYRV